MNVVIPAFGRAWENVEKNLAGWRTLGNVYISTNENRQIDGATILNHGEPWHVCRWRNIGLLESNKRTPCEHVAFVDADVKILNPNVFDVPTGFHLGVVENPHDPNLGGTCVVNAALAIRINGYDERFVSVPGWAECEDTQLYNRLGMCGARVFHFKNYWVHHIEHPGYKRYAIAPQNAWLFEKEKMVEANGKMIREYYIRT